MQFANYELSVLVNGRPLKEYGHKNLTFIEGRKKTVYTIRFKNNTAAQVLAVVSIDGLNVVDGKPATAESRGYIVPPYCPVEIKGWRTSNDTTCDFVFADKPMAYSTQSQGQDINCGVVAVKVFAEKVIPCNFYAPIVVKEHHHHHHHDYDHVPCFPRPLYYWERRTTHQPEFTCGGAGQCGSVMGTSNNSVGSLADQSATVGSLVDNSATVRLMNCFTGVPVATGGDIAESMAAELTAMQCNAVQDNPDFNLGTGWGKSKEDRVVTKDFERGYEMATFSVFYTDAEGLKKVGIDIEKKPAITKVPLPQGFGGFCVPPKVTGA